MDILTTAPAARHAKEILCTSQPGLTMSQQSGIFLMGTRFAPIKHSELSELISCHSFLPPFLTPRFGNSTQTTFTPSWLGESRDWAGNSGWEFGPWMKKSEHKAPEWPTGAPQARGMQDEPCTNTEI